MKYNYLVGNQTRVLPAQPTTLPRATIIIVNYWEPETGYRPNWRVRFPASARHFFFSTASRPALRYTQSPIQCVPVALSLRGTAAGAWSWSQTSIYCLQSTVAVAQTRGQFGNADNRKRLLLEAVTRRLVKKTCWRDSNVCSSELQSEYELSRVL
jgi:hypothetical protein